MNKKIPYLSYYKSYMALILSPIECPACQAPNERNHENCIECEGSLGFPNVNILIDDYFKSGLEKRYQETIKSLEPVHQSTLNQFEALIKTESKAVINMKLEFLLELINKDRKYLTYQEQIERGLRPKAALINEVSRLVADSFLYGGTGKNIVYAALSLDTKGLFSYGDTCVVLKEKPIQSRTTVIERNSFDLYNQLVDMGWRLPMLIPAGFYCIWEEKHILAVVKLGKKALAGYNTTASRKLILFCEGDRKTDEFIELHILGSVNYRTFQEINVQKKVKRMSDFQKEQLLNAKDLLDRKDIAYNGI